MRPRRLAPIGFACWLLLSGLHAPVLAAAAAPVAATGTGIGTGTGTEAPVATATPVERGGDDGSPAVRPAIVAAHPNPVAGGDAGEFAVVAVPPGTNASACVLTDGDWRVGLAAPPNGTRVAVANHARARRLTDLPVVVRESLSLANAGERLRVRPAAADGRRPTNGTPATYREADEGAVVRWNGSAATWRPLGATDRPVVSAGAGEVRAFVLPDAPGPPIDVLRGADDRLLLAGYTLTSRRVADALVAAHRRNVTVRVLLEGEPVGERTRRGARLLDRLERAGVTVRVLGGPRERYAYHHAKYAVADDRAVVLTENWKPAGTGGNSSRGWGVVTRQRRIVEGLAATFRADVAAPDARAWSSFRRGRTYERGEGSTGEYPRSAAPERVAVNGTDLLVAPDNAGDEVAATIDGAESSVDVVQVTLGGWDERLPRALRRAAGRGVRVRLLLSDAWYVREDNDRLVKRFREWADRTGADLSARTASPRGRFEKIHAKGAVVDGDRVLLGSLNWNDQAAAENREVVLRLRGRAVASYYGAVFDGDWPTGRGFPVGLVAAGAGIALLTALVVRRIDFADDESPSGFDPTGTAATSTGSPADPPVSPADPGEAEPDARGRGADRPEDPEPVVPSRGRGDRGTRPPRDDGRRVRHRQAPASRDRPARRDAPEPTGPTDRNVEPGGRSRRERRAPSSGAETDAGRRRGFDRTGTGTGTGTEPRGPSGNRPSSGPNDARGDVPDGAERGGGRSTRPYGRRAQRRESEPDAAAAAGDRSEREE